MTGDDGLQTGLVSVVVPTYDRSARMLGAAIESILDQRGPAIEVIVVDDGSAEPVAPMVAAYGARVSCQRQENKGIGAARNAGVSLATGEFLAFLDSDDVWMPGKVTAQLAALSADHALEAVFGRAEQFYDEEVDLAYRRRHPIKDPLIDAYLSCAMLIRRTSFERIGTYIETESGVDIDWFLRAKEATLRVHMLSQVVYRRRLHETNLSITNPDANKDRLFALKRSLDRRRAAEKPSLDDNSDRDGNV